MDTLNCYLTMCFDADSSTKTRPLAEILALDPPESVASHLKQRLTEAENKALKRQELNTQIHYRMLEQLHGQGQR